VPIARYTPAMRRAFVLLLVIVGLAAPATAGDLVLPSWLQGREADARWLMESGDRPRAMISLWDNGTEVVLYLPGLDTNEIVRGIERYAVYEQTEMVESSFCTDGAFFTGTRLTAPGIDVYQPTVTSYRKEVAPGKLHMWWTLMPRSEAADYVRAHRDQMARSLRSAGLDRDLDEYIEETVEKLGGISSVEGSHRYEHGFYSYKQEIHSSSKAQEALVRAFGAKPQLRAALKSALFSIGREDLAGPPGEKGVKFDLRGAEVDTIRPGK